MNAVGIGFQHSYAAYYLGLLLFLIIAATNFVILLSRIWEIREGMERDT
jgi:hypothetical protein